MKYLFASGKKSVSNGPALQGAEKSNKLEEVVCVNNAGLVLLSPFLMQLFHQLGLMDQRMFWDFKARQWAALLLQYMVYGKRSFAEEELKLNKIIVGLNDTFPNSHKIIVSRKEQEALDDVLHQMIQSWTALRGISPEGVRKAFLRREGILMYRQQKWFLTVKPKPQDEALDYLPWRFTPIHHPWMDQSIQVTWRRVGNN